MPLMFHTLLLASTLLLLCQVDAACFDPSPAFPPPKFDAEDPILSAAFASLEGTIGTFAKDDALNTTSFSVQVTSSQSTLWSYHHTARELNSSRVGANPVDGDSFYRIASITKTFTTLALLQQAAAGNLSLDDPVIKYLPELKGPIPWKDMTLRTIASQLSGVPRDWSQGDLLSLPNPIDFGLPTPNNTNLPDCYGYNEQFIPCNETALYKALAQHQPLFPPNQQSTYSNTNFELLGLVLARSSGLSYEECITQHIFDPLNISSSAGTFSPPPDNVSVLPYGEQWYYNVDEGIHNPTGGLYMTTSGMASFLRYVLTHFNSPSTLSLAAGNWFTPHSFTASTQSYYGMPWEIYRPNNILKESKRAVSFFTKGGGLPGYITNIIVAPEYDLAFTIFTAGNGDMMGKLREEVTVKIIRAAEDLAAKQITQRYAGTYSATGDLNSSLTLAYTPAKGLYMQRLVSNGTATFDKFATIYPGFLPPGFRAQLVPTLLYVDEENKQGEKWRFVIVEPQSEEGEEEVWDDFCVTNIEFLMYDGLPVNEVVFWDEGMGMSVDLTAFRVRLEKEEEEEEGKGTGEEEEMVVQDL